MSSRALTAWSLIVLALAAAIVFDRPRPPVPASGRLLPALDARLVDQIEIRRGAERLILSRQGDTAGLVSPLAAPVAPGVWDDLAGTLEYLSYRRRLPRASARGLDPPRFTVAVTSAGEARAILIGDEEPALGLTWAAREGEDAAYLVEAYAARALDVRASDVRDKRPFRLDVDAPGDLRVITREQAVVVKGGGTCLEWAGGCVRPARARLGELVARLGELDVTRFVEGSPAASELTIEAGGQRLDVWGECPGAPGERFAVGRLGPACLDGEAVRALAALATDTAGWIDRDLLPVSPPSITRIELAQGGASIALARQPGGWRIETTGGSPGAPAAPLARDADVAAVREWLEELASFHAVATRDAPPLAAAPPGATRLAVSSANATHTLWLLPGPGAPRVQRQGEPLALELHPAARAALAAPPWRFVDRTLLSFEPTAVSAIEYDDERAQRGATLDDWTLTAPASLAGDAETIAALRDVARELRASAVVAPRASAAHRLAPPRRRLTLVVDPPPGSPDGAGPVRHTVELGARTSGGECYAKRPGDDSVLLLDATACEAIDTHLATRRLYEVSPGGATAVSIGAARWERHGAGWFDAAGARLPDDRAARLDAYVRALAVAPEVVSYAPLTTGTRVVVEQGAARAELTVAGGEATVAGRPVRYRLAAPACEAWPEGCR